MTAQRTPVPRNVTALVELVENKLGYDPYEQTKGGTIPVWKVKAVEAGKLNRAMAKSNGRLTLETLTRALDYAVEQKKTVQTPFALVAFSKEAAEWDKRQGQPEVVSDLEQDIEAAVALEQARDDADAAVWLGRFMRAAGPSRSLVYSEWKQART